MYLELFLVFLVGGASAIIFSYVFHNDNRARLYALECDLADLQERHLKMVRKQSINSRWDKEAELDDKIGELAVSPEQPKREGWTKWGSSKSSNSEKS